MESIWRVVGLNSIREYVERVNELLAETNKLFEANNKIFDANVSFAPNCTNYSLGSVESLQTRALYSNSN